MMIQCTKTPRNPLGDDRHDGPAEEQCPSYIDWLADYVFRPAAYPGSPLEFDAACREVAGIATQVAFVVWETAFDALPPEQLRPRNGGLHSDFLYREALSRVLSRVHPHEERVRLLQRFYCRLNADAHS